MAVSQTGDAVFVDQVLSRNVFPYLRLEVGKRSGGSRVLHSPEPTLMSLQRVLLQRLLYQATPHPAAFAYRPGISVVECAQRHLRS